MIAHVIHQIEYIFSWNDALPNDVELTFVVSAIDQCKFCLILMNNLIRVFVSSIVENKENKIPSPFHFVKENIKKVYIENETNHLMGRLTTLDGKIWLKFLPNVKNKIFFLIIQLIF